MGTSQTSLAKPNSRGLDLEKTSRLQSRQKFFLDIPFDRTHGAAVAEIRFIGTDPGAQLARDAVKLDN